MRLVLCDGNRILCEALAAVIEARGHQVVAITTTVADGIDAVAAHRPDAVLLDPRFPGVAGRLASADGVEDLGAVRTMRERCPDTALMVLSSLADPATWSAAMKMGVVGFLRKDRRVSDVADALDVVANGGVVLDPRLSSRASQDRPQRQRPRALCVLTPREKEVLRRIVAGQSTARMAGEMNITTTTLRTYVKNVLAKLGAHNRLEAAALATRGDLLSHLSA